MVKCPFGRADHQNVDQCEACGAAVRPDAGWCGQCFRSRHGPPPGVVVGRAAAPVPARSRWRRTQTSFGPVGRLLTSALLLAPMWFFWQTQLFAWPGLVIWGVFVLPWGLRETWQRTRLPHVGQSCQGP